MTTPSPLPTDEDREALQRLIYTFETTDLGDNLAITTRDSYALVDAIFSAGFRRSVVSTPKPDALFTARNIVNQIADHYSEQITSDQWVRVRQESNDMLDEFVLRLITAVSAPPTITDDELLETYRVANERAMHEANLRDGFASNMSRESILAGLRAVAALGGEEQ